MNRLFSPVSISMLFALLPCLPGMAAEADLEERFLQASPSMIEADEALTALMNERAGAAIEEHCAACHGAGLEGREGVPNLVDYNWLWGVSGFEQTAVEPVMEIMQTILYGIRNVDCPDDIKRYGACPDTRFSQMPAYGGDIGFSEQRIDDLAEYVLNLSGREADQAAVQRASEDWETCTECHGDGGEGYLPFGGPNLQDDIWLYGSSREQIRDVITNGRAGQCPAWHDTLDPVSVKALAVYIYRESFSF